MENRAVREQRQSGAIVLPAHPIAHVSEGTTGGGAKRGGVVGGRSSGHDRVGMLDFGFRGVRGRT